MLYKYRYMNNNINQILNKNINKNIANSALSQWSNPFSLQAIKLMIWTKTVVYCNLLNNIYTFITYIGVAIDNWKTLIEIRDLKERKKQNPTWLTHYLSIIWGTAKGSSTTKLSEASERTM